MNVSAINTAILNIIYPVGTIIQNYDDDTNPGDRIPNTTWVRLNDTFLVNEGSFNNRSFNLGSLDNPSTGGEELVSLTVNNLPRHRHSIYFSTPWKGGADPDKSIVDWSSSTEWKQSTFGNNMGGSEWPWANYTKIGTYTTSDTGNNNYRHNNMPPYTRVYGWYRIS